MRAGLIAAGAVALALLAAGSAQAARAPVPCTNVGSGHYECGWYVPGDGIHGGALVVVGASTVGYLHQGRNWVVCQQVGGDVRNAAGDRNDWYGWTQADNWNWGWASPLDAEGGDDYGGFGGGTPNCNGAHGSPPAYTGIWGRPPPPGSPGTAPAPPPGTDADRDGVQPPADCDDTNSRVHPGAPEVANDGIDQDCNGADAAGRLSAIVSNSFTATRTSTRVARLRVTDAPAGASVSVTCKGKGKRCPRPRTFAANAQGRATLTGMFTRRLKPGARIEVAISAPNTVGKVVRFTIRHGHTPRTQTLCLPPGGKPGRC
jgi:hypothetical protein